MSFESSYVSESSLIDSAVLMQSIGFFHISTYILSLSNQKVNMQIEQK
nr:MAG TPA: hypothetical protein [Caudoviricetes sp.]